mmetsp:Transcript_2063/g.4249  ORF Transcript_2063/g.4249 Transcript_2063/m.4249 type:complete len:81 (+) Transcript_2063:5169-5411(+)
MLTQNSDQSCYLASALCYSYFFFSEVDMCRMRRYHETEQNVLALSLILQWIYIFHEICKGNAFFMIFGIVGDLKSGNEFS